MVRFTKLRLGTGLLAACLCLLALPAWSAAAAGATGFTALDQPARVSRLALHKAMLDVTRAGARLVAVGEEGVILLSDDNGHSWRQVEVPVSAALTSVQFVDAQHGWAVGHFGVVLATQDGGEHWHKQLDGIHAAALVLKGVEARAGQGQKIGKYELKDAKRLVSDGPDKPFLNLYFSDTRNGFVFGAYNLIFRTHDGGQSWQPWLQHVDNPMGLHLYGMAAANGVLILAGEQGTLLRSTDNGAHFDALDSPYDGSFFGITAEPDGAFVAYGLRGHVFRSTDNGDSWQALSTGQSETLSAATLLANGRLLLTSQAGDLLIDRAASAFKSVPNVPDMAPAGVVQSVDGAAIVASLSGMHRIALPGQVKE